VMDSRSCSPMAGRAGAIALIVTLLFSIHSYAASKLVLDSEHQFQFAEQFFQRGEYYRAIGEYERFIYFFPLSEKVELVKYRIGLSYLKGEQYEQAIQAFYDLIEEYQDTEYAFKSYLGISKAYVSLKRYAMALTSLNNLITIVPDQEVIDEAYYQRGWVYLEMGVWGKAIESFEKVSLQRRDTYNLNHLLAEIREETPLEGKNPAVAGLLAIIPGAGHLYCERERDALVSFLVNGALIYTAYEAFDNELYALGGVISLFELGFYAGNIYSAISSAHKYNRDKKDTFLQHLRQNTGMDISLGQPNDRRSLLLFCHFYF
jgi:tetratricopeptide (TPR) repeat protein